MQCSTDPLPTSRLRQALYPPPSSSSCVGVSRELSQGSTLALWQCVRVCLSASHVALYSKLSRRGVLFVRCGSSKTPPNVRGPLPHNLWPLQPSESPPPPRRVGDGCVEREAQSLSSSFYLHRLWLGQRCKLCQTGRQTDKHIACKK